MISSTSLSTTTPVTWRSAAIAALIVAGTAACGSGSNGSSEASADRSTDVKDEVTAATPGDDLEPATETETETETVTAAPAGDAGTGSIEIGDVRHDLEVTRCISLGGAIGGEAVSVTEPDNVSVTFEFSPEGWSERDDAADWAENGTVRLDSDDPYEQWDTGLSLLDQYNFTSGLAIDDLVITSYDTADDVESVTGTARFIELNAALAGTSTEPTEGTFSFSCPPTG